MQTIDPHSRPEYEGPFSTTQPVHQVPPAPVIADATEPIPGAPVSQDVPVDALVSSVAGLVLVTTGHLAAEVLDEVPREVALTPLVAFRIAELLRVVVQYSDFGARARIAGLWQEEESPYMPQGRVVVEETCVRFGIEPIGAGALVAVLWEHVPAVISHLEHFAEAHRRDH